MKQSWARIRQYLPESVWSAAWEYQPPTPRQLKYLRDLGVVGKPPNKLIAHRWIQQALASGPGGAGDGSRLWVSPATGIGGSDLEASTGPEGGPDRDKDRPKAPPAPGRIGDSRSGEEPPAIP